MRMIITGGGTGGHIYPAIAIAKRVRTAVPDSDILYVGSEYGLEADIVKREGIAYQGIKVRGFDRKNIWRAFKAALLLIVSFYQSYRLIKKFKPDLVLGTGGYVSGPVVMTAALMRIDTMIHEQNVIPGFTTRFLSKYVKKILISFKESIPHFKEQNKLYYTGVPVREIFYKVTREQSRRELYIADDELLIVSLGGSNGAVKINELSKILAYRAAQYDTLRYIHVTGKRFYSRYIASIDATNICDRVTILDYTNDIFTLLSAADLVISRAGALSLSEFAALSLPAILIPSPHVADNHQYHNAKVFEKAGSAIVLEEDALDLDSFLAHVERLIENPDQLDNMRDMYRAFPKENALNTIMSIIFTYQLR